MKPIQNGVASTNPPEEEVVVEVAPPVNIHGYRVYFLSVVTILYVYSLVVSSTLSVQYVYERVKASYTNDSDQLNVSVCGANDDRNGTNINEEIQRISAQIQVYFSLADGIPSIFMCIVFGSLSDRIGRKFLFALPVSGALVFAGVYAAVSYWNLSMYFLFIGYIIQGFSGGFSCFLLGAFAGSSDLTKGGKGRTLGIAVIEACGILSQGLGSIILGFMIDAYGYTAPNIMVVAVCILTVVLIIFGVPETRPITHDSKDKLTPQTFLKSVYRVFRIYTLKGKGYSRALFITCLTAFFLTGLCYIGGNGVELLFLKNQPLCWDAVTIGYFQSLKSLAGAIAVIGLIRLLQCCLEDVGIGIFCALAKIASLILEGFAKNDVTMYIVAVIQMPAIGVMAMTRAIMSKYTPRGEMGAMFASVACAEASTRMVGGILFNSIYKATLHTNPGAIFFVLAAILGMVVLLYGLIYYLMYKDKRLLIRLNEKSPLLRNGKDVHA